jgi:hypothetical protein
MPRAFLSDASDPGSLRALDVRRDDADARDFIFRPSLQQLPDVVSRPYVAPVLDQGAEGACVGFALATVINVSLERRARTDAEGSQPRRLEWVSQRMLYEIGRRYDEWEGDNYEGTSLRGAMKGWHKHGVTTDALWRFYREEHGDILRRNGRPLPDREFTPARVQDALRRPVGAYYRIVDSDVSHMQAAVWEGDAVLASAWVHAGWQHDQLLRQDDGALCRIPLKGRAMGLHAFAIVGYTPDGFIIQNSWGPGWGSGGFALLRYEDWFENRQDAWVARPGPETRDAQGRPAIYLAGFGGGAREMRAGTTAPGIDVDPRALPFLINTGDRGALSGSGDLQTQRAELAGMAEHVLAAPRLGDARHIVLYAHGGLNSEAPATRKAAALWHQCDERRLRGWFFVWETGWDESLAGWFKSTDDASGPARLSVGDLLSRAADEIRKGLREAQRLAGAAVAPVARTLLWDEMKGRAEGASAAEGGAALFAEQLFDAMARTPNDHYKIHLVAHSAGSIYLAWLYEKVLRRRLAQAQAGGSALVELASIQFMAPAITVDRARQAFFDGATLAVSKERFAVYTLTTENEESDAIGVYPSSLLTYVADHLEDGDRRVPVLGIRSDLDHGAADFATAVTATRSTSHGDFDDDGNEIELILDGIAAGQF